MESKPLTNLPTSQSCPEYRKECYKYTLYIVDEFTKFMKGILIKDKEAETVVTASVFIHWVIGVKYIP